MYKKNSTLGTSWNVVIIWVQANKICSLELRPRCSLISSQIHCCCFHSRVVLDGEQIRVVVSKVGRGRRRREAVVVPRFPERLQGERENTDQSTADVSDARTHRRGPCKGGTQVASSTTERKCSWPTINLIIWLLTPHSLFRQSRPRIRNQALIALCCSQAADVREKEDVEIERELRRKIRRQKQVDVG